MRRLLVLLALLMGTALAAEPSPLVYPEQSIPLQFSHRKHLELGVQCVVCHGAATTSNDSRDSLLPDHRTCGLCHRIEQPTAGELYPKAACSTCHQGVSEHDSAGVGSAPDYAYSGAMVVPPVVLPPPHLKFPHATHIDAGVPCLTCHAGVETADLATRADLPSMATCLECHNGGKAPGECTTCHLQGDAGRIDSGLPGGRLQPSGRFRPDDHGDPRWLKIHQSAARSDGEACEACHAPQTCLVCHDGVVKNIALHPADWVMTHGLEAQRRTQDCFSCHEVQDDCQSCHASAQVTVGAFPGPRGSTPGQSQFHPEGWGGTPGTIPGPDHHSHQARRALETCEACHTTDLCKQCHGAQVSPHPETWAADLPDRWRYGQGDGQVCLECHLPGDPNLARLNR